MALLNFKEIPEAGKASGHQDTFELFGREVLELLGFKIIQGPSRGADGGKDLIVEEVRAGLTGTTTIRWLTSCKHFAPSGKSVRPDDEKNIFERVSAAGCHGFLGFYSTLPSSGLNELLHNQKTVETKLFDHEEIERHLLASAKGRALIERYFPESAKKLQHSPAVIFDEPAELICDNCGKDLLNPPSGIWSLWTLHTDTEDRYIDMHFSCKGECDRIISHQIKAQYAHLGSIYSAGWDDIPDMVVPTVFIHKVMGLINLLYRKEQYDEPAIEKMKHLLLAMFPLVSRHLNDADKEKLKQLQGIPSYLGGMGFS